MKPFPVPGNTISYKQRPPPEGQVRPIDKIIAPNKPERPSKNIVNDPFKLRHIKCIDELTGQVFERTIKIKSTRTLERLISHVANTLEHSNDPDLRKFGMYLVVELFHEAVENTYKVLVCEAKNNQSVRFLMLSFLFQDWNKQKSLFEHIKDEFGQEDFATICKLVEVLSHHAQYFIDYDNVYTQKFANNVSEQARFTMFSNDLKQQASTIVDFEAAHAIWKRYYVIDFVFHLYSENKQVGATTLYEYYKDFFEDDIPMMENQNTIPSVCDVLFDAFNVFDD